jgi:hypothetical protein
MGNTVPPTEAQDAKIPKARILRFLKWWPIVAIDGEKRKPAAICVHAEISGISIRLAVYPDPDAQALTENKLVKFLGRG